MSQPSAENCPLVTRARRGPLPPQAEAVRAAVFLDLQRLPMSNDNPTGKSNPSESPSSLPPSESKIFRRWRREFSLLTGYGIDPAERVFTINRRNCERWKKDLLTYSAYSFFVLRFPASSQPA
jgi:hypothetical protein